MTKEDIEFLRELQHELNTQSNESNADPVIWGVMETVEQIVPSGCGDKSYASDTDGHYSLEELIEICEENVAEDESLKSAWQEVDKGSIYDVIDFCNENLNEDFEEVGVELQDHIAKGTGAFLTRKAAVEYIDKYGYNHSNPRPWSMCAYRNFELQRLLKILKSMNIDNLVADE